MKSQIQILVVTESISSGRGETIGQLVVMDDCPTPREVAELRHTACWLDAIDGQRVAGK